MTENKGSLKRPLIFLICCVIFSAFAVMFFDMWNKSYNDEMLDPFWKLGNVLMAILYISIYTIITRGLGGFKITYMRAAGLFGSQLLGLLTTNAIAYIQISLIGRGRLAVRPIALLTLKEAAIALVWCIVSTQLLRRLYPPRRMIIVYGNQNSSALVQKMSRRGDKYQICESVSCDEDIEYIKQQILRYEAVIISDVPSVMRNKLLKFALDKSIRTYITPKLSDIIIRGSDDFNLFDTPLLLNRNEGLSPGQRFIKRTMDIVLVLTAILISSPIMIFASLAVKLYDRGPVFYKQKRLTKDGREFDVIKFRSMVVNAENHGAQLAGRNDKRITPVGKVLRKIRVDELPQLFNILKGDMSFVGPRPERPEFCAKYEKTMPEFRYRLKVKAGLTGYAQIMGKYSTTPYDKLKLDLIYIENQSFLLDMKIMMLTAKTLFTSDAAEGVGSESVETHRELHPKLDEQELDKILK